MNLKNPFSQKTRNLFIDIRACVKCKRSDRGIEHDHIFGRISNSPLNLSPLCTKCHYEKIKDGLEGKTEQLKWTVNYLNKQGYVLKEKDYRFLEAIEQEYKEKLKEL